MSTTIESLELEIRSSSQSAESGLDKLATSLEKLRTATQGGLGLSSIAKNIRSISDATNSINSNGINSLSGLARAIQMLSGVKVSSTIATQITAVSTALNGADFSGSQEKLRGLAEALTPLSNLPKTNLSSYVNNLKKLPEALNALDEGTIAACADKMQKLATALKPLGDEMQKVANGFSAFPSKIQKLVANTNSLGSANTKAATSYVNLYAKLRMAYTSVRMIAQKIGSWIGKMNDYIENVNLFNASMGEYASEAQKYAEHVGEVMGIDPGEWMRNQGVFMTLATGFGVAGDRASVMSQQLTQLGYDLSSFFNISYEDAMQKLQSGLSGELEPLRRLGYDLSQAKLEAVALSLGIDKSVSSMTQAEKAQLRYYAIMTQVTTAQGDMSRTLNAPANQLRIFKSQVNQAARALGSIFIPAMNAVLPYAIAFVKVIRILAENIAALFGFEMPEVDYSGLGTVAGDTADGLDDAAESAKKLKSYMLGFDELNVINPNDDSGSSIEDTLSQFDFELPTYDFIGEATNSRVNQIVEEMKEWLGITEDIDSWSELMDTRFGTILTAAGGIGTAIGLWKVTDTFKGAITTLKGVLDNPTATIAIGATLTITGFALEFDGLKDAVENGLDEANFGESVGGSLLATIGGAITGAGIAKLAGTVAVATGALVGGSIAAIIAGIPMYFVGIYDACVKGLNWLNGLLIPLGSTLVGAGIGALFGPVGLGIGALVGLIVGLITDFAIWFWQQYDTIKGWFLDLPGWAQVVVAGLAAVFAVLPMVFLSPIGLILGAIAGVIIAIKEWENIIGWVKTNVAEPLGRLFDPLLSAAGVVWGYIYNDFVVPILDTINHIGLVWGEILGNVLRNAWEIISGVALAFWSIVTKLWEIFSKIVEICVALGKAFYTYVLDPIIRSLSFAAGWVYGTLIQPILDHLIAFGKLAYDYVIKPLFDGAIWLYNQFIDIMGDITNFVINVTSDAFKGGINGILWVIEDKINNFIGLLNGAIDLINKIPGVNITKVTKISIPRLADGGVLTTGQMFIARERGAELVGNIGGKTAVMNNDQIVESVSAGVYSAVVAALGSNGDEGGNTQIVINLDGEKIYENQQKVARNRGYNLGMGAFSFG